MIHYKLSISYSGQNYHGMQIQPGNYPTIQGEIHKCLEKMVKSNSFKSVWSGRTDTGVHALAQVGKISLERKIPLDAFLFGLNNLLNQDIRVLTVEECDDDFHPQYNCKIKEYLYLFTNFERITNPFFFHTITNYPFTLDFQLIEKGIDLFVGKKDFFNYYNQGTPVTSTIREIYNFTLEAIKHDSFYSQHFPHPVYALRIQGNGFLKQMVRLIVGALFDLGRGKISLEEIHQSLHSKIKKKVAPVAPPNGLYLAKVIY